MTWLGTKTVVRKPFWLECNMRLWLVSFSSESSWLCFNASHGSLEMLQRHSHVYICYVIWFLSSSLVTNSLFAVCGLCYSLLLTRKEGETIWVELFKCAAINISSVQVQPYIPHHGLVPFLLWPTSVGPAGVISSMAHLDSSLIDNCTYLRKWECSSG